MTTHDEYLEKELHHKFDSYIQSGKIKVIDDMGLPADYDFIYQDFPWKVECIDWENVPNSNHLLVSIPYKPEESQDFTARIIKEHNLKGDVVLYGDLLLNRDYRMDISLLPTVLWEFMQIPLCLYAVNPEQKWCFSFNSFRHLNFGYAPEKTPKK